jgi:hypothetical protein
VRLGNAAVIKMAHGKVAKEMEAGFVTFFHRNIF